MDMKENYSKHNRNLSASCADIYDKEADKYLKALKRFREEWLRLSSKWDNQLFQYADPEFYFYRFAIERQERNTEKYLLSVLLKVMDRYGIEYLTPKDAPFAFIICTEKDRIGYRLSEFNPDDDVNRILRHYDVRKAIILQPWKPGVPDEWIRRANMQYEREKKNLTEITLEQFFIRYFGPEEYTVFSNCIDRFVTSSREILGYKSIKFLSLMNLSAQKQYEKKELTEWQYNTYRYQIIDPTDKRISDYLYLPHSSFSVSLLDSMQQQYVDDGFLKAMIGSNDFSHSFITSEWLFHSLEKKKNFDYTAIISGYLKSIEQLLYSIVMINSDNNCKISMNGSNNIRREIKSNHVTLYKRNNNGWSIANINDTGYKYIDLTHNQIKYMDSSIGTFEHFLRFNPHIFVDPSQSDIIADMVSCFRIECRNGYLHTHNLYDWNVVKKTRANAIYLYFVLLGGCIIPKEKENKLGIIVSDDFDELCKKIRKFGNYNPKFIFEYAEGPKKFLIYDYVNNTVEYSCEGVEHYDGLLFYQVEELSIEALEKLDAGIQEEQKVFITRDNLPVKIFAVHRDGHLEEIPV